MLLELRGLDYVSKIELQLLGCWEGRQSTDELPAPNKAAVCSSRRHCTEHHGDLAPFQSGAMAVYRPGLGHSQFCHRALAFVSKP